MVNPNIEVDPRDELQKAIKKASKEVGDLTIPLRLIAQYWFKSNEAIFSLKGPGKWPDLSPRYKAYKASILGSPYPIMLFTGRLMASITAPPNGESINKIINKRSLVLGTGTPYASYLANKGRNPVLYGAEQTAPKELNNRIEAWQNILLKYVADKTDSVVNK